MDEGLLSSQFVAALWGVELCCTVVAVPCRVDVNTNESISECDLWVVISFSRCFEPSRFLPFPTSLSFPPLSLSLDLKQNERALLRPATTVCLCGRDPPIPSPSSSQLPRRRLSPDQQRPLRLRLRLLLATSAPLLLPLVHSLPTTSRPSPRQRVRIRVVPLFFLGRRRRSRRSSPPPPRHCQSRSSRTRHGSRHSCRLLA